jgi:hypothetical protein
MKNELTCEHFKPINKSGKTEKCFCKFLNRKDGMKDKLYKKFMKNLEQYKVVSKENV